MPRRAPSGNALKGRKAAAQGNTLGSLANNPPGPEGAERIELPDEWQWARLGELFDIQPGKALNTKNRCGGEARPFLRAANGFWGYPNLSELDEMGFTRGASPISPPPR